VQGAKSKVRAAGYVSTTTTDPQSSPTCVEAR
jgi:hypothetical protein